ncbi:MAG: hypothetical protein J07HQW2_00467 [Haloquadratum walsbyi J07HQW2]|uniref:Uncharacterized protein n=1 Tax=Haloquadratum walsbyi J07HQW2 TaxID=1238425 RepID=U1NBL2_9EURY|nr:MAG: hypothetical protein J07HQW2_00467 [Haloquadratum walsbyi J07HQW2]
MMITQKPPRDGLAILQTHRNHRLLIITSYPSLLPMDSHQARISDPSLSHSSQYQSSSDWRALPGRHMRDNLSFWSDRPTQRSHMPVNRITPLMCSARRDQQSRATCRQIHSRHSSTINKRGSCNSGTFDPIAFNSLVILAPDTSRRLIYLSPPMQLSKDVINSRSWRSCPFVQFFTRKFVT